MCLCGKLLRESYSTYVYILVADWKVEAQLVMVRGSRYVVKLKGGVEKHLLCVGPPPESRALRGLSQRP